MTEPAPTALTIASVKHVLNNAITQWHLAQRAGDQETAGRFIHLVEAIEQAYPDIVAEADNRPQWPAYIPRRP